MILQYDILAQTRTNNDLVLFTIEADSPADAIERFEQRLPNWIPVYVLHFPHSPSLTNGLAQHSSFLQVMPRRIPSYIVGNTHLKGPSNE